MVDLCCKYAEKRVQKPTRCICYFSKKKKRKHTLCQIEPMISRDLATEATTDEQHPVMCQAPDTKLQRQGTTNSHHTRSIIHRRSQRTLSILPAGSTTGGLCARMQSVTRENPGFFLSAATLLCLRVNAKRSSMQSVQSNRFSL